MPLTISPLVTVIMPVRNEARHIQRSLGAVLAQDYPADRLEVIVVDGMSEDGTREIVQGMIEGRGSNYVKAEDRLPNKLRIPVVLMDNTGGIVPVGLNAAIRQASGDIIVRIDGHAVVGPQYIRTCVDCLQRTGADNVGGVFRSVGSGYVAGAIAAALGSRFAVGDSAHRTASSSTEPFFTDSVPFGAFRKEVFERIGLFNESMVRHQDYEFNYRLRKADGRILIIPSLQIDYYVRSGLRALWRQYWMYGLWKGRFIRAHPDSLQIRHLVPPVFVLSLILCFVLAIFSITVWPLGLLMLVYGCFIVFAIISLAMKGNLKYMPVLAAVLACLHLSYGFGVWAGILFSQALDASSPSSPQESHSRIDD